MKKTRPSIPSLSYIKKILGISLKFNFTFERAKLLKQYYNDYRNFKKQLGNSEDFKITKLFPIIDDNKNQPKLSGGYYHQDHLIARKIFKNKLSNHLDVGSSLLGFVTHISCFREIDVIDIRPTTKKVKNINFKVMDFMKEPKSDFFNFYDSISSLHAIEHFGLGRYGDDLDVNGHLKGIKNLTKLLKKNGTLYFSAPIGPQRIEFNAHRIFSISYLLKVFQKDFNIMSFSYVNDKGELFEDEKLNNEKIKSNFNCNYGVGIFELKKTT